MFKVAIETLEKGAKYVVVLVFLLFNLNIFTRFSSFSIIDFEQVNVTWIYIYIYMNEFYVKGVLVFQRRSEPFQTSKLELFAKIVNS